MKATKKINTVQFDMFTESVTMSTPAGKHIASIVFKKRECLNNGKEDTFFEVTKNGLTKSFTDFAAAKKYAEKNMNPKYVRVCADAWGLKVGQFKALLTANHGPAILAYERLQEKIKALKKELATLKDF